MIDEIRAQEHRVKYELPTHKYSNTVQQLFDLHETKIINPHQRKLFERVSKKLLSLLPSDIKIADLKKAHFQKYIDTRLNEYGKQSKKPVKGQTVNRELNTIAAALTAAPLYFTELDDYQKFVIPKARTENTERERMVERRELDLLLSELRAGSKAYQRVADDIEFRAESGLRRKEVARLKPEQYFAAESALREVKRWKTGTVTRFFPLTTRACEIIENRLRSGGEYIFSRGGKTSENDYRIIAEVCGRLEIKYGRFEDGGFVLHDLRRNFASELIQHTDIKTAQEFLGHSKIANTAIYLKTDERRMSQAIRRASGIDVNREIIALYKAVRRRKIDVREFLEMVKKIGGI